MRAKTRYKGWYGGNRVYVRVLTYVARAWIGRHDEELETFEFKE